MPFKNFKRLVLIIFVRSSKSKSLSSSIFLSSLLILFWVYATSQNLAVYFLIFLNSFNFSNLLPSNTPINNTFIKKSLQNGCIEKVPGYWEHISMVWAALKEAKSKNLSLATIWFDIANAYESIPHKLIIFALHRFGVSPKWIHLIETYYSGTFSKSFSQESPSSWYRQQRGIFVDCTLSITLFLAGMNIILEYSLVATTPQFHLNNISLPPIRAFMDDLNIMSSTICGAKTLLSRCTIVLN